MDRSIKQTITMRRVVDCRVPTAMRNLLSFRHVFLALSLTGCAGSAITNNQPPPPSSISVVVSPPTASIRAGDTFQFSHTASGTTNTAVTWSIIGGGSSTLGTISASGNYTAPGSLPNPNIITVRATSSADSSASSPYRRSAISTILTSASIEDFRPKVSRGQRFARLLDDA